MLGRFPWSYLLVVPVSAFGFVCASAFMVKGDDQERAQASPSERANRRRVRKRPA